MMQNFGDERVGNYRRVAAIDSGLWDTTKRPLPSQGFYTATLRAILRLPLGRIANTNQSMKDAVIYALPAIILAFLAGHELSGGKYQIEAFGTKSAFFQLNTTTGATRLCELEPLPLEERGGLEVHHVTVCGQWRGKD